MNDYVLTKPHVFEVEDSEGNKVFCVKGEIQYADRTKKSYRPKMLTVFQGELGGLVSELRQLLPKTGTWLDNEGKEQPWNGVKDPEKNADGSPKPFGPMEYKAVCDYLFDEGYTNFSNGIWRTVPFDQPMVMLYSQDMAGKRDENGTLQRDAAGHVIPLYKKGTPVCYAGTKTVYVYRECEVFVRLEKEGVDYRTDVPMMGWKWTDRRKSVEKMYVPLSAFLKKRASDAILQEYDIQASDIPGASREPDTFDPDNANAPEV